MGWMGWMGGVRGWGVGGEDVQWIVRGTKDAEFHPDILKKIEPALTSGGWQFEVEGGGKILHEPDKKSLKVFSKSTGLSWRCRDQQPGRQHLQRQGIWEGGPR